MGQPLNDHLLSGRPPYHRQLSHFLFLSRLLFPFWSSAYTSPTAKSSRLVTLRKVGPAAYEACCIWSAPPGWLFSIIPLCREQQCCLKLKPTTLGIHSTADHHTAGGSRLISVVKLDLRAWTDFLKITSNSPGLSILWIMRATKCQTGRDDKVALKLNAVFGTLRNTRIVCKNEGSSQWFRAQLISKASSPIDIYFWL